MPARLEDKPWPNAKLQARLNRASKADMNFSSGRIFGAMCTKPHPKAVSAHLKFIESNLGNRNLYPGTARMEREVIDILGTLLKHKKPAGQILAGGSEANIVALWVARNNSGKNEVVLAPSVHFSLLKACDLLGLKPRFAKLDKKYRMDAKSARKLIGKNTAAVVATAGTTEFGAIDPVSELGKICQHREVHFHVDGALGGFMLPVMKKLGMDVPRHGFDVGGVTSYTVDPHKMAQGTIPAGALLVRNAKMFDAISVDAPYLGGIKQASILGTRGSGAVAGAYAAMRSIGMSGYRKAVKNCLDNTGYMEERLRGAGVGCVVAPQMNILGINVENLDYVYNSLTKKGWNVSQALRPQCLRVVMMPHTNRKDVDALADDVIKLGK